MERGEVVILEVSEFRDLFIEIVVNMLDDVAYRTDLITEKEMSVPKWGDTSGAIRENAYFMSDIIDGYTHQDFWEKFPSIGRFDFLFVRLVSGEIVDLTPNGYFVLANKVEESVKA